MRKFLLGFIVGLMLGLAVGPVGFADDGALVGRGRIGLAVFFTF